RRRSRGGCTCPPRSAVDQRASVLGPAGRLRWVGVFSWPGREQVPVLCASCDGSCRGAAGPGGSRGGSLLVRAPRNWADVGRDAGLRFQGGGGRVRGRVGRVSVSGAG